MFIKFWLPAINGIWLGIAIVVSGVPFWSLRYWILVIGLNASTIIYSAINEYATANK